MTPLTYILAEGGEATFWLPKSASNLAPNVDWVFDVVLYTSIFFFCVIVGAMTFFVIKYRRRSTSEKTPVITHNTPLEIVWTGVPLVLVVVFFYIGFKGFIDYDTPRADSYVIQVEARQWAFRFMYPNGGESSDLYVPINRPVKIVLTSKDVLHALYIPEFRTQRNAVPGRTTEIWFIATKHSPRPIPNADPAKSDPGGFTAFCTQYCGDSHSRMMAHVFVLDEPEFQEKLKELANPFKQKDAAGKEHWVPYVELGQKLATSNCFSCHTTTDKDGTAPTWKGLYKSTPHFSVTDVPGFTLTAADNDEKWEAYLRESILHPSVKIVQGFPNIMSDFTAQFFGPPGSANDEKLRAIMEYIKSLGPNYAGPHINGKQVKEATPDMYDVNKDHPNHPESLNWQQSAATQPTTNKEAVP